MKNGNLIEINEVKGILTLEKNPCYLEIPFTIFVGIRNHPSMERTGVNIAEMSRVAVKPL